jgi:nucleotide-binding universal stress UspA family protein
MIAEGEPADVIDRTVRDEGIDLVMMPTHGKGRFRRLLLGSVTSKVLHDLSCAVWTGTHAALEGRKAVTPYQSIVCAVDFVEESQAVLNAAAALARRSGASLHLVHAVGVPSASYQLDLGPYRSALLEAAHRAVRKLRDESGIKATISVDGGTVSSVMRAAASRLKADLIVTGRGHAQDLGAGVRSALYTIIRDAPCPVLSI